MRNDFSEARRERNVTILEGFIYKFGTVYGVGCSVFLRVNGCGTSRNGGRYIVSPSGDILWGGARGQQSCSGSLSSVQSVVFNSVVGKRLACCPFFKRVSFSRECSPDVFHLWNLCSLDKSHCGSRGRRLKFASYGVDSLRVVWVCPKIVDLSFLNGGDVHG